MAYVIDAPMPTAAAKARTVHCVFLPGSVPGLRVLSRSRPSTPSSMNRRCQRQTVGFDVPVPAMIAVVPWPWSTGGMNRACFTCLGLLLPSFANASSRPHCSSETSTSTLVRRAPTSRS